MKKLIIPIGLMLLSGCLSESGATEKKAKINLPHPLDSINNYNAGYFDGLSKGLMACDSINDYVIKLPRKKK